jgi:hypothetical protein
MMGLRAAFYQQIIQIMGELFEKKHLEREFFGGKVTLIRPRRV